MSLDSATYIIREKFVSTAQSCESSWETRNAVNMVPRTCLWFFVIISTEKSISFSCRS